MPGPTTSGTRRTQNNWNKSLNAPSHNRKPCRSGTQCKSNMRGNESSPSNKEALLSSSERFGSPNPGDRTKITINVPTMRPTRSTGRTRCLTYANNPRI